MFTPALKPHLTPLERHQVRTLIFRDGLALFSIFLITICLAVATYFLFNSYSDHRKELAARWFARGETAAKAHQPAIAIEDYHSALLYAPGQRQIEIALASALGSAGKIQEATAYFNTLRETEPGNGEINLQLARLAARAHNQEQAKLYFHAAIYGNWEGDGYLQRRSARIELVTYLISVGSFEQARSELLVASGNAPSSDLEMQSKIAALLVEDHFPADALNLYQQLLAQHPGYLDALEGAAATAYTLGHYESAYRYLERVVTISLHAEHDAAYSQPDPQSHLQADKDQLHLVNRIVTLDPSTNLPPATLATRLLACQQTQTEPIQAAALQALSDRWESQPKRLKASDLIDDPNAEDNERKLIDDTEETTAEACGQPQGDDAALLRLALVPSMVDAPLGQTHE
jgi:tetratricopeptide (TPR) repeat protein